MIQYSGKDDVSVAKKVELRGGQMRMVVNCGDQVAKAPNGALQVTKDRLATDDGMQITQVKVFPLPHEVDQIDEPNLVRKKKFAT